MTENIDINGYSFSDPNLNCSHSYILPIVKKLLLSENTDISKKIFELGCGNGSVANELSKLGFDVTGVDPSDKGIELANKTYPDLKLYKGSAYDDLPSLYGKYPIVISFEVIEHVFFPRKWAKVVFELLDSGGIAVVSAPYHGYFKNLALAITGKMDKHFTALWDYGHIKFWSVKTLKSLLEEAGFTDIRFLRVGRIPVLAKAMIAIAKKK